ncbi:MAG: penicillin-binding protein 2, partial [Patescibacteria group bacterium]|nr:penicillin-binding protein 2 [Patescibacteria group bacterium]
SRRGDPYERIAEKLTEGEASTIRAMELPGVTIERDRWRIYPGGAGAAHALGFIGFEGDERKGRYGLERYYEDVLGRSEGALAVNFFAELFAGAGTALRGAEHARGDLELTIEPSVEAALERELAEVTATWHTAGTGGIIMDPKTGAVMAMAAEPTFNPNEFAEADSASFANPLVEHVFEMGSIIKPLTLAAGLDAGVITPESTYYDAGSLTLDTWTISNFDGKGRGRVSMQTVLNESLNTGAAYVALKLGSARFAEYFRRYGLGEETGIDVPNETRGLLGNLDSPRSIEYATASFGQGIALTPIGTARALASLANGGLLVTPHVVARVATDLGVAQSAPAAHPPERILSAKAAEEITRMLVKVVDEALVGGAASLPHYSIAAKTGTAQIANSEDGGYYEDRFLHAFFGYFPAYDPRFLIFFYAREPQGVRYASQTLTTPFMDLARFLIGYYEIAPDR